jgi:creatinine amidohydrolase
LVLQSLRIEDLSWTRIREALDAGYSTIIIPIGSIEQHGPHLPIASDAILGEELGSRVAKLLGNALVAPCVRPGCSPYNMDFAGTIDLKPETLSAIVFDYVDSFVAHGFRNVVLLPTHGGNFGVVGEILPKLRFKHPKTRILAFTDLQAFVKTMNDPAIRRGISLDRLGSHAGVGETAGLLAMRRDLVHMSEALPGFIGDAEIARDIMQRQGMKAVSKIGVMGDPRSATTEMGNEFLEKLSVEIVDWIRNDLRP